MLYIYLILLMLTKTEQIQNPPLYPAVGCGKPPLPPTPLYIGDTAGLFNAKVANHTILFNRPALSRSIWNKPAFSWNVESGGRGGGLCT
jgi:hypothetical protein